MKGRPSLRKGQKISQESKDRISKAQDHKKRPVICVDTGEVFDSKYDVVKKYGLDKGGLQSHLRAKSPQGTKGMIFRFLDEYDPAIHKPLPKKPLIVVHDKSGNYIGEYKGVSECRAALGLAKTIPVNRYLEGDRHGLNCKGYNFSYKR